MVKTLRFILGDQLSRSISSLQGLDPETDMVMMAEVPSEATFVKKHKRKIAFVFATMRHFAAELRAEGIPLDYTPFGTPGGPKNFTDAIRMAVERHRPEQVVITEPGEWRTEQLIADWAETLPCPVLVRPDTRFLSSREAFARWAARFNGKGLLLETFYRGMRQKTGLLMNGKEPEGGAWNYDAENREPLPKRIMIPERPEFPPDVVTRECIDIVAANFGDHFGRLEDWNYPVTRADALLYLRWFIDEALPSFGKFEDAMRQGEPLLFHSHLSALLNAGLLLAEECVRAADEAYRLGQAPLNAAEGFIRQIIGWREYIRGIYWLKMPDYGEMNALGATQPLPWFYWSGETKMNCMAQSIGETLHNAFAHHIQRLMVIGNFSLIAGLDPKQVQEWYLVVYHDAYDWVELPNVVGLILHADGGFLASKPYAASGSYINRMSDYCKHCRYDVKQRTGPDACPFNYLYWDFIDRHRDRFALNRRMSMMYKGLDRFAPAELDAIRQSAAAFLTSAQMSPDPEYEVEEPST